MRDEILTTLSCALSLRLDIFLTLETWARVVHQDRSSDELIFDVVCGSIKSMRTTLDIDEDVLETARELARRQRKSIGKVISDLGRQALMEMSGRDLSSETVSVFGFRPFPKRGGVVTNDRIDALREDDLS